MLKKILLILISACLVLSFTYLNSTDLFSQGEKTYYLYNHSSTASIVKEKSFLGINTVGESTVILNENFNLAGFLVGNNARKVFTEELNELTVYYCYSPKIKRYKVIKGQKINLQIAVRKSVVTVGSPLIYGSY